MMCSDQRSKSAERVDTDDGLQKETLWETVTSCRWVLSYVGCICFTLIYALRVNMGIAIVCMVKAVNTTMDNSSTDVTGMSTEDECLVVTDSSPSMNSPISGDIEWDKATQGWVLSSFFYGYMITMIPGGWLSGRYGGKYVMLIGLFICGLSTIALPFAARYEASAILVIILRVINGLATGVSFPAMQNLLGGWSPPFERSKLSVLCFSGTMVGSASMLGLGGFFCEGTVLDGGWPSMFYVGGGMCLLFCLVWMFTVYNTPEEHPRISKSELLYIQKSLGDVKRGRNTSIPWRAIITSPAMWAIISAQFCTNFGNYTLMTKLPAYMKEVLKFDIKSNGLYSTLPYIAMFVVANTASHIIDKLREKGLLSTAVARKIAMTLAFVIPAGFLVGMGHIPCGMNYLGIIFLTLAVGFTGFHRSGYYTNPQDIASRYAGELFAISNTIGTTPGIIAPLLVNSMTPKGTANEWQRVFYVWASIYVFGAIMYIILARGETQDWALDKKDGPENRSQSTVFQGYEENIPETQHGEDNNC